MYSFNIKLFIIRFFSFIFKCKSCFTYKLTLIFIDFLLINLLNIILNKILFDLKTKDKINICNITEKVYK